MNSLSSRTRALVLKTNPTPSSITSQSRFLYQPDTTATESVSPFKSILEKFASFLDDCDDIYSLRKLHACIFACGLGNDPFLGSKILLCYAKFGSSAESRWVFNSRYLSLWNSVLVRCFRTCSYGEILWCYLNLRQRKVGLDGAAITFSLKSCAELGSLEFGRGLHVDAFKFGLSMDRFVGSSLMGLYSKHGEIGNALKVFDEITEKDVVAYTTMITAYVQVGDRHPYQAFGVVRQMQKDQIDPNRVTLVSLLKAAAQLGAFREGRSMHGYAIRRGIGYSDEVLETSLMDMYIKCKAPGTAGYVFGKMNRRTIGSRNAMVAGHLQMGQPLAALELFCLMVQENVMPDLISLANAMLCCADLKYLFEGKSIHGYIVRSRIQLDLVATTALIDMYSQCNKLVQAKKLFDGMGTRDVISYNVMMVGYFQNGYALEALQTLIEMVGTGIRPNQSSILTALSALSDLKGIRQGRCVHGYALRHGYYLNVEVVNQIVYMYAKCGCIDYAKQVFNRIRCRDLVSWTSMMMGYVSHGHADEAIILFQMMKREGLEHDLVTLITLLQALSQLGYLSLVKEVHSHLYRFLMEKETSLINSLITTYARCGKLNMAEDLFEHMEERCLTSWNTIIAAHGMHGNCSDALDLFESMKKEEIQPDKLTFTSLLTACSHSGLMEEGLQVFRSMSEDYSITPSEEHYGCVVDLLSRAGQLEEAYDLVKCLPSTQSASALSALLAACRVYRNTELGQVIGRQLLDLEPDNSSAYGLVSNLYAEDGMWDEVARIRAMAKRRGLEMTPGYSLIELD